MMENMPKPGSKKTKGTGITTWKMTYEIWAKTNLDDQDEIFKRFLKANGQALDQCHFTTSNPDRAASNLRWQREYHYFEGLQGWAEYVFPKPADMDSIDVSIKLTTADPRPFEVWVDGTPVGTRMQPYFLDKFQTGTYGPEGLQWVNLGVLNCPGGRTNVKLKIVPVGYAPHIAAVAVLPMSPRPKQQDMSPQTKPSKPLPGGSWIHSARNYKVTDDGKLVALLEDRRRGWHSRTVDFRVGDEFENIDGNFSLRKINSPGVVRVYGDYEIIPELDFAFKFDVMNMKADDLDKVCEECKIRNCNVFVVAHGRAYLKRVMIAEGRPTQSPNRSKTCKMYAHKEFASAITGGPELWYWSSSSKTNRRKNGISAERLRENAFRAARDS